ncbi:hypothetical protein [Thermococcus sp.]|uniref:hypothetical protein n=1 Tax=Thermococcus sp. TaxID=35749 RepID=UPI0025E6D9CB|nr:hypothetical protein [Thermococcus sp.]
MELRDYLMPGEYILGIIRNVDVNYGDFKNFAITNRRFILFNTKKKRSLFKSQEDISKMSSVAFGDACGMGIKRKRKNFLTKEIQIEICGRLTFYKTSERMSCDDKRGFNPITLRRALPLGPPLEEVSRMIFSAFDSVGKNILEISKDTETGDELIDFYVFNPECVSEINL